MKIIVVGALGLIGSSVVRRLFRGGHVILSVDNATPSNFEEPWRAIAAEKRYQAVTNFSEALYVLEPGSDRLRFSDLAKKFSPDVVINCGGDSLASEFKNPALMADETMTRLNQVLLNSCLTVGARYLYVSSSMVYGDFTEEPVLESAPRNPLDPYGALKLGCESLVGAVAHQFEDFDYAILRPSAVYGALDSNKRVLVKMLHDVDEGRELYFRDIQEKLDFTPVSLLAELINRVAESPNRIREAFNVSNGRAHSMKEVFDAFQEVLVGVDLDVTENAVDRNDVARPKRGTLSMARYSEVFGEFASVEIAEGIEQLFFDSQENGLFLGRLAREN